MNIEDFKDILYEKEENGIATITINRPERRNACSPITFLEMRTALDDFEADKEAKVLILTGNPEGNAFSSGLYVSPKLMKEFTPELMKEIDLNDNALKGTAMRLFDCPKPIVVAFNGLGIGAGFTLPLVGGDLIYASPDAYAGFYFRQNAIQGEYSSDFILSFYLGFHKAKEIMFFGKKLMANELKELGLINDVFPADELMSRVREIALDLIAPKAPGLAIKMMKKSLHDFYREDVSRMLDIENENLAILLKSRDMTLVRRARAKKETPVFKGK